MIEILAIIGVGGLAASLSLLYQFKVRLADANTSLAELKAVNRGLTNRLLAREGVSPVFTEDGVQIDRVPDNAPFAVMKPPFAAAQDRWEREDQERHPMTLAQATGAVVPDLTDEQRAAMLGRYSN